jgi:hypothetical protein
LCYTASVGQGEVLADGTRALEAKEVRAMAVVYDPTRVRTELPEAADWLLDGVYHLLQIDRDQLIGLVTIDETDAAAELLEEVFPEEAHRLMDEGYIASLALAFIIEREVGWVGFVENTIDAIDADIGYYMLRTDDDDDDY